MLKSGKLSHKLMAAQVLFALFIVGIIVVYQGFFLEGQYKAQTESMLKQAVEHFNSNNLENQAVADYNAQIEMEWYDATGNLLYATEQSSTGSGHGRMSRLGQKLLMGVTTLSADTLAKLEAKGEVLVTAPLSRYETDLLIYAKMNMDGSILLASTAVAPIESAIAVMRNQLAVLAAVVLAVALVLGAILSVLVTVPVRNMEKVVHRMAEGDFGMRVAVNSSNCDELANLGRSINHMAHDLSKIENLRKELVANVSHELRTPLGIIRGYAEMLQDFSWQDEGQRNLHLGQIVDETERLSGLVATVLDLSQIESDNVQLNKECIDVVTLVQAVVLKHKPLATEKHIDLEFAMYARGQRCNDLKVDAEIDGLRLTQILDNVIGNGLRHTPLGGKIEVGMDQSGKLWVTDTGAGIDAHALKHIWERYYSNRGKGQTSGVGLGLAIVKALCEQMGIDYGVTSEVGLGSTFWFQLRSLQTS